MKKINEIFYSIQGEGFHVGTPAVFVRFSGCNLKCPFCDTQHQSGLMMNNDEILAHVKSYPAKLVILTGGEPSLFIDHDFVALLHEAGKYVAIESNGTHLLPDNLDWITISPKYAYCEHVEVVVTQCNEVKVVYESAAQELESYFKIRADHYYLQPCDKGEIVANKQVMQATVQAVLQDPRWRISLQTQAIMNIR